MSMLLVFRPPLVTAFYVHNIISKVNVKRIIYRAKYSTIKVKKVVNFPCICTSNSSKCNFLFSVNNTYFYTFYQLGQKSRSQNLIKRQVQAGQKSRSQNVIYGYIKQSQLLAGKTLVFGSNSKCILHKVMDDPFML